MTLELLKSKNGRTLIESHCGVEGDVPENSWLAIQLGHQMGGDLIEVDVQLSRDGVPFIRHNYQLPDGRWCHDLPWDEIKDLRIDGEPLPALEDVLGWARDAGTYLSLDLKTFFRSEGCLSKEVVRLLERTKTRDRVLLLFFDANGASVSYGILRPEDIERFHSMGTAVGLVEYWNVEAELFRKFDIDVLACGSPQAAQRILGYQ